MAEATQFFFDYQEVLRELIKKQGLTKGRWKLIFEIGFTATNMSAPAAPGSPDTVSRPAGVFLIQKIGITQTQEENNLTLDAAEVNLRPAKSSKRPVKKGAK